MDPGAPSLSVKSASPPYTSRARRCDLLKAMAIAPIDDNGYLTFSPVGEDTPIKVRLDYPMTLVGSGRTCEIRLPKGPKRSVAFISWPDGKKIRSIDGHATLNGEALGDREALLQDGDALTFDGFTATFGGPERPPNLEWNAKGDAPKTGNVLWHGNDRYNIDPHRPFVIGADPECDLHIPDDEFVSSFHCRLFWDRGYLWLQDLKSRNGTEADGLRVSVVSSLPLGLHELAIGDAKLLLGIGRDPDEWRGFVAKSPNMASAVGMVKRASQMNMNIVLRGETGTGKDVLARAYHAHSGRTGEFVVLNCAGVHTEMLRAEIYGYDEGAFTGADEARAGLLEQADGGTLFLDEVGELDIEAQRMLLPLLSGEGRRVGGQLGKQYDVNIVAATHQNLERMIDRGEFDGEFSLKLGPPVHIPPLRERPEDLVAIAWDTVRQHYGGHSLSPGAEKALKEHSWPRNVRELWSVLRNAMRRSKSVTGVLEAADLDLPWRGEEPRSTRH